MLPILACGPFEAIARIGLDGAVDNRARTKSQIIITALDPTTNNARLCVQSQKFYRICRAQRRLFLFLKNALKSVLALKGQAVGMTFDNTRTPETRYKQSSTPRYIT